VWWWSQFFSGAVLFLFFGIVIFLCSGVVVVFQIDTGVLFRLVPISCVVLLPSLLFFCLCGGGGFVFVFHVFVPCFLCSFFFYVVVVFYCFCVWWWWIDAGGLFR
jgi:hypothetical protein